MKKLYVFLSIMIASYTTSFCQNDYFLYWDFNDKKEIPNLNVDMSEEEEEAPLVSTREIVSASNFEIHGLTK